jgi:hypothetical protein
MNRICGMTSSKAAVAALLCCVSALVTGCSTTSQFIGPPDNSPVTGAAIEGVVHGGQNPVIGASVQLWAVGASNYGSTATALGSSVPTVGPGGTFTLGTYTCPTAPSNGNGNTYVYITASGGDPGLGTGTNSNIMLAAALGSAGTSAPARTLSSMKSPRPPPHMHSGSTSPRALAASAARTASARPIQRRHRPPSRTPCDGKQPGHVGNRQCSDICHA